VLAAGAAQALAPDEGRTQFGLPVSAEFTQSSARLFASTGFFSHGVWFAGGGAGFQVTPKVGTSLSFTRSWATGGTEAISRDQQELSGGVSYLVKSQAAVYAALGRTIATTDDNGAGTTISAGTLQFASGGSVASNFLRLGDTAANSPAASQSIVRPPIGCVGPAVRLRAPSHPETIAPPQCFRSRPDTPDMPR
jgi:hypothetical protein